MYFEYTMYNFLFTACICFFTLQKGTNADNCGNMRLNPNQHLLITIFDNRFATADTVCKVIKEFPKGLITLEFKPGATATGTKQSIKCGSSDCKTDQFQGCVMLHFKYIEDCYQSAEGGKQAFAESARCYCGQESNQLLLDNAALRAKWNIPENAVPTLAFNQKYDSCFKALTYEAIKKEICQIYNSQVKPPC